jgi:ferric-dicitrate binding protein FerR (iron transport regulator)
LEKQFLNIVLRKTTLQERYAFFEELNQDPEKKRAFEAFQKLWVVNNMAHRRFPQKSKTLYFRKFWGLRQPVFRLSKLQLASAVAATAAIVLLIGGLLFSTLTKPASEQFVLKAPKGNITNITLKDGSELWLNSSSIATVTTYGNEKTIVDLKGEAFFDVVHDNERDFLVKVGNYFIVDKGTSFNVKYNAEKQLLVTSLFDGTIDFLGERRSLVEKMKPGTEFSFDIENKKLAFSNTDKEFVTAWKDGKFVFVNKSLSEITRELEEWYDVQFVFKNKKIKDEKFSGVIKRKTSIEHLLKVLQISSKSTYKIEEMENGKQIVIFE